MKNTWKALLTIIISAVAYSFLTKIVPAKYDIWLTFVRLVLCLVIGFSLSSHAKRNNRWVGKVVIAIVILFIFGIRLNVFVFDEFYNLLSLVGLTGFFLDILLVYCGWAFYLV